MVQDEDEEEEPASEATSNTEAIAIGVASGLGVLFVGTLVGMAKALHLVCCVLPAWPIPSATVQGLTEYLVCSFRLRSDPTPSDARQGR